MNVKSKKNKMSSLQRNMNTGMLALKKMRPCPHLWYGNGRDPI